MTLLKQNRYLRVLVDNGQFRKLWLAQVVSQLGDWFSSIALYTLILSLTGSAEAVGIFVGAQFLPAALAGYWTGPLADRFGRRGLMLVADLGRGALALCYLFIDRPERVPWIYVITVLMVLLQAVFEPARKSALPDIVSRKDMVLANAIAGATWSSMLALGAAVGGLVSGLFGNQVAFLLNAASFLLSAYFVSGLRFASDSLPKAKRAPWGECLRYLRKHPRIAVYSLSKTLWCTGGGIALVLTLYGRELFPLNFEGGEVGALSIGLFYAFRGLGAGFGPFLAYRMKGQTVEALTACLFPSFLLGGLGYLLLARASSLPVALLCVLIAHLGGATQWVFSTSLLQLSLAPDVRGRVFALEYTCLNLAVALSSFVVGRAGDGGWSPPQLAQAMGITFCLAGGLLGILLLATRGEVCAEETEKKPPS
jgi:MFS family permease